MDSVTTSKQWFDRAKKIIPGGVNSPVRSLKWVGGDPVYFVHGEGLLMAPAYAIPRLLARNNLRLDQVDLWEIHEAFAATALGSMVVARDEFKYDLVSRLEKGDVNPNGGTLAIGHPLGATGIRVLINQLLDLEGGAQYAMGSICAGGGVGGALILEKA